MGRLSGIPPFCRESAERGGAVAASDSRGLGSGGSGGRNAHRTRLAAANRRPSKVPKQANPCPIHPQTSIGRAAGGVRGRRLVRAQFRRLHAKQPEPDERGGDSHSDDQHPHHGPDNNPADADVSSGGGARSNSVDWPHWGHGAVSPMDPTGNSSRDLQWLQRPFRCLVRVMPSSFTLYGTLNPHGLMQRSFFIKARWQVEVMGGLQPPGSSVTLIPLTGLPWASVSRMDPFREDTSLTTLNTSTFKPAFRAIAGTLSSTATIPCGRRAL